MIFKYSEDRLILIMIILIMIKGMNLFLERIRFTNHE